MAGKASYQRRDVLKTLSLLPAAWMTLGKHDVAAPSLVFSCSASNDLYKLLASGVVPLPRYETPEEAVAQSAPGSGVLILAEGYPTKPTHLDAGLLREGGGEKVAPVRGISVVCAGTRGGEPCAVAKARSGNLLERIVVASDAFSPALEKLSILDFHDGRYVPINAANADLSLARVAGFDKAVYGLPAEGVKPILFKAPGRDSLVSTSKLSQFVTGRYEPVKSWGSVWTWILEWLYPDVPGSPGEIRTGGSSVVWPTSNLCPRTPNSMPSKEVWSGTARQSCLYILPGRKRWLNAPPWMAPSPGPPRDWPLGDGSQGMLEGFSTVIESDGSQLLGWWRRNDCMGETSMAMALSSALTGKPRDGEIAANLNDFIYFHSTLAHRDDPAKPDVRVGGMGVAEKLRGIGAMTMRAARLAPLRRRPCSRRTAGMKSCCAACWRTCAPRGSWASAKTAWTKNNCRRKGGGTIMKRKPSAMRPTFRPTCGRRFSGPTIRLVIPGSWKRRRRRFGMTMAAYPDKWRWTNGIQQERARMLLPLAWLVRIEDSPEHRQWLKRMAEALLALQDECGALREEIGSAAQGAA